MSLSFPLSNHFSSNQVRCSISHLRFITNICKYYTFKESCLEFRANYYIFGFLKSNYIYYVVRCLYNTLEIYYFMLLPFFPSEEQYLNFGRENSSPRRISLEKRDSICYINCFFWLWVTGVIKIMQNLYVKLQRGQAQLKFIMEALTTLS